MSADQDQTVLRMTVKGNPVEVAVKPAWTLLGVLREELRLTGTKKGCDQGDCGACMVLMDGNAVNPLQDSFIRNGAVQCGSCTAGMLMSAAALLEENPHPNTGEIKRAISGNLCRCTGYVKIIKAVQDAAA